ncbi:MAG: UDP-N-acetylmuramoyl-L-alanyl-D-glutamate--2,6-diaminopimelate ligase [Candidatus Ryanbacteria bacterium]|nr:UDP-N-acetylmuramoyl-L-alanyl-D-glutamate--2,6-diaminopimelate ligase [Candidatus Ryanbacteria bacterium]
MRKLIPQPIMLVYHWCMALTAALWYQFPSRKLTVIGVTGTNGKSTTVEILHHVFEEAGHKTASASSLRFRIGSEEVVNDKKMTMPGRFFVQKFLFDAKAAGCDVVILETTSEGARQFRHAHIAFDTVAITNLTPEHIESHGGFEQYREAKLKIFRALNNSWKKKKHIIVNATMTDAKMFLDAAPHAEVWEYARDAKLLESSLHAVSPTDVSFERGVSFMIERTYFESMLEGEFNLENILCAIAVASAHHVPPESIRQGIGKVLGVAGRLEYISREPFAVVVDYAHTPDALEKVYQTLKPQAKHLVCVLGAAGGGRDKWKRPELGKIADQFCDEIILTDEDPYDEDPKTITDEVSKGITTHKAVIELDRKKAIEIAIQKANAGDTIIITGKGFEPLMVLAGGKKIPWDDRAIARNIINKS